MHWPNIIIGAGPAGLAVAGRLRKAHLPFIVLEESNQVAHRWHHHYDRLHLHTVKQLSHLPYEPFPDDYPTYVSRDQLVNYYEAYATKYGIEPHFNKSVKQISKSAGMFHVSCGDGSTYRADNIILASGINREPYIPVFKNQDSFTGDIIHSRNYKNHLPFKDKSVLVIGHGEYRRRNCPGPG